MTEPNAAIPSPLDAKSAVSSPERSRVGEVNFPWWRSIAAQLTAGACALLTFGFAISYVLTASAVEERMLEKFTTLLQTDARVIRSSVSDLGALDPVAAGVVIETALARRADHVLGVRLVSASGEVVLEQHKAVPELDFSAIPDVPALQSGTDIEVFDRVILISLPLVGEASGTLQVLYDKQVLLMGMTTLLIDVFQDRILVLVIAGLAVFGLLNVLLSRPLAKVIRSMQAIAGSEANVDLPLARTSEMARINAALAIFQQNMIERQRLAQASARAQKEAASLEAERDRAERRERDAAAERAQRREEKAREELEAQECLQRDMRDLFASAADGDFGKRMATDGVPGSQYEVRTLLNTLFDSVQDGFTDAIAFFQDLADGKLNARLDGDQKGVFADLRATANLSAARLQEIFDGLLRHASQVLEETSDLSASAEELSKRTERTAGSLAETTSALEQITGSIADTAKLAQGAKGYADSAREEARQSDRIVKEAIDSMREIQDASAEISHTLCVINDIAFQTNLLALNAGVEAARAGDAGRGFAVVASEVRALAGRASDAAQQIGTLIETSSDQINLGVQRVARTGDTLVALGERIDKIGDKVAEISLASDDQSTSVGAINRAMGEIDAATQQNTAMFEEMSTANLSLKGAASQMLSLIEQFDQSKYGPNISSVDPFLPGDIPTLSEDDLAQEHGILTADPEEVRKWDRAITG